MPEDVSSAPTFEASLDELERIVRALEKGDLPLEQSLSLFETGMRLSSECKRQLEEAETRVEILMKKGPEMVAVPLNPSKLPVPATAASLAAITQPANDKQPK